MPDHSSRFYTARLRLSAAVAGAIAAAALALGSGLVPARAVAEEGAAGAPQASEAAKAEAVKRIMAGREFKIMFEYEDTPFCRAFLEDFQAHRGIEYIEPIARAKYYSNPAFQPYRDRCPGWELNKWIKADMGDGPPDEPLSEADLESFGDNYFGTRNFKLYRLDIDNDPANGEEYVFYAERYYWRERLFPFGVYFEKLVDWDWNDLFPPEWVPDDTRLYDGGYNLIDFAQCKLRDTARTSDSYDYFYKLPRTTYNAIIKYKGKHYIYDLREALSSYRDAGPQRFILRVEIFNGRFFDSPCSFEDVTGEDGG